MPTSRVCVGWLLARVLRLRYLRFLPPCLRLCVCWLCWLLVPCPARARSRTHPHGTVLRGHVASCVYFATGLLLPCSVLFETETATRRSRNVSK
uniref:Uncharacterized protein n=1 Tax=Rhipicephalus pulchellus TaxID=72859 RepID=L7LW71_RHIPC